MSSTLGSSCFRSFGAVVSLVLLSGLWVRPRYQLSEERLYRPPITIIPVIVVLGSSFLIFPLLAILIWKKKNLFVFYFEIRSFPNSFFFPLVFDFPFNQFCNIWFLMICVILFKNVVLYFFSMICINMFSLILSFMLSFFLFSFQSLFPHFLSSSSSVFSKKSNPSHSPFL